MKFEKFIFGESLNGKSIAKYIDCDGKVKIVVENNGEALENYVQKSFACEADYAAFVDAVTDEKDQIENRARAVSMLLYALQKLDDTIERHTTSRIAKNS